MTNSKKILLTTALVSGLASAAMADAPTVTAGGKVDFQASFAKQSVAHKTANTKFDRSQHFSTESRVSLKAAGMSDFGMQYGATVELGDKAEFGSQDTTSTSGKDVELKDTMLFVQSDMGRIELGSMAGPAKTMKVGAESIARATGGICGDWSDYVNKGFGFIPTSTAATNISGVWLTAPNLPFDISKYTGRHNKIAYYTPEVQGLQIGVSYALDTAGVGSSNAIGSKYLDTTATPVAFSSRHFKNAVTAGVKYKTQYDMFAIEVAATGQYGKAAKASSTATIDQVIRDVKAYNVGAAVTYANITLAGSYGDQGRSMNTKETDAFSRASTKYYTAGASIVQSPVGLSVTYFDSKRMKNKVETISVGADYALAAGMMPYVEGTFFKLKPAAGVTTTSGGATAVTKNKGNVVLVGTKFNF